MRIQAVDLRVGYIILINGKYGLIMEINSIERGRGKSYVYVIYRSLDTGNKNNIRLATDEHVEKMNSIEKECIFLYRNEKNMEVMLSDTFEQLSLNVSLLAGNDKLLVEGMKLSLTFIEETEEYIAANFPHSAIFEVKSRDNSGAVIGDGDVSIKVPDFIQVGDKIIVNIEEEKYLSKE